MKFYKQPPFVTLLVLGFCMVVQLIFYRTISLLHTINLTFLFSAFFLFIGFFLAMISMGTFDSSQFLLKNLFKRRPSPSVSKPNQDESTDYWSKKVGKTYLFPLNIGFTLFILCMIFLAVYYLA